VHYTFKVETHTRESRMLLNAMDHQTDAVLARQAREGSLEALGELYERHAERIFETVVRMLGEPQEAEDVVHDLFVGLPDSLHRYREQGTLLPWMRSIAIRMALMRLRREKRSYSVQVDMLTSARSAEHTIDSLALQKALASLPEPLRTVFILKEVEGYAHAEIAELLNIRTGTSEVRLHRATKRLRDLLRRAL
jgi:RNA polymerase sigma-70 factor, ECF subfamily